MDSLVEQVTAWAKLQPEILALYLYGSVADGRANLVSDLDIGLLVRGDLARQELWQREDRWASQWPEVVDLRVLNYAPLEFQYEVTTRGQRLWCADEETVAEYESLIRRKYWDEAPRLATAITSLMQQGVETRNATEQQKYQSTLDKVTSVHRRVREAAAGAIRRLSS